MYAASITRCLKIIQYCYLKVNNIDESMTKDKWTKEKQDKGVYHIYRIIRDKGLTGQDAYIYARDYADKHGLHYIIKCSKCGEVYFKNGKYIPNKCNCLGGHPIIHLEGVY